MSILALLESRSCVIVEAKKPATKASKFAKSEARHASRFTTRAQNAGERIGRAAGAVIGSAAGIFGPSRLIQRIGNARIQKARARGNHRAANAYLRWGQRAADAAGSGVGMQIGSALGAIAGSRAGGFLGRHTHNALAATGRGVSRAAGALWRNRGRIAKTAGAAALGIGALAGAKKARDWKRGFSRGSDGTINLTSFKRSN